jgi:protein phosphatase
VSIELRAVGATHTGRKRRGNEDAHRIDLDHGIFLVADGMGGHAAGEIASELAAAIVSSSLAAAAERGARDADWHEALRAAVRAAHAGIAECCEDDTRTRGMGTTLTACVLEAPGLWHIGHIGDSRAYLLRDGVLGQLTRDHTWVQHELDSGLIAPDVAAKHPLSHILTRVLTADLPPEIDVLSAPSLPGDLLLLATDGLYNMLSDSQILALLTADSPLPARAASLITAANRAGGMDNITAIVIEVE